MGIARAHRPGPTQAAPRKKNVVLPWGRLRGEMKWCGELWDQSCDVSYHVMWGSAMSCLICPIIPSHPIAPQSISMTSLTLDDMTAFDITWHDTAGQKQKTSHQITSPHITWHVATSHIVWSHTATTLIKTSHITSTVHHHDGIKGSLHKKFALGIALVALKLPPRARPGIIWISCELLLYLN